jgi:hypothetical protein
MIGHVWFIPPKEVAASEGLETNTTVAVATLPTFLQALKSRSYRFFSVSTRALAIEVAALAVKLVRRMAVLIFEYPSDARPG